MAYVSHIHMLPAAAVWLRVGLIMSTVLCLNVGRGHGREPDLPIHDGRWQSSQGALHSLMAHDTGRRESEPQRTIMQCLGTSAVTRACHFENVYYDIKVKRFVYFGTSGATPELFGAGVPDEPWLRLIRCAPSKLRWYNVTLSCPRCDTGGALALFCITLYVLSMVL